jgi:hypothetical protein
MLCCSRPKKLLSALGFNLILLGGCTEYRGPGRLATLGNDLRGAGRDLAGAAVHEVPPHTPGQWAYLGGLAVTSAYLETRKEDLRREVLRSHLFRNSGWTDIGGQIGLSRTVELFSATLYTTGLLGNLPRTRETGLLMGESLLASQTATGLLKLVFSEQRPQQGGALRYFRSGGSSSASVHVTNAMAVARVLDYELSREIDSRPERVLAGIGIYALPAVTAWQRLRSDQHYLWNVVLGGGASYYTTSAVLRQHDRDRGGGGPPDRRETPRLVPLPVRGRGAGLLLVWSEPRR